MDVTPLNTREDMVWLAETHLKAFSALFAQLHPAFVLAVLTGNEDSPDTIDLFSENHYQAPYLRFALAEDGSYYCVGVRHQ